MTTEATNNFIKKAREIHGDTYDYAHAVYTRMHDKITITCSIHGNFDQLPYNHLKGKGCKECGRAKTDDFMRTYSKDRSIKSEQIRSTEQFIKRSEEIYGDLYTYEKAVYTNGKNNIIVTCKIHGDFTQKVYLFLYKQSGCKMCSKARVVVKRTTSNDDFLMKAKTVHGTRYDYSVTDYKHCEKDVDIICTKHGKFKQRPNVHLKGGGCPHCANEKSRDTNTLTVDEFITRAHTVHGVKYDYTKVVYKSTKEKIEIICPKHGSFWQTPHVHLALRCGCGKCVSKISKRERMWLDQLNLPNSPQHRQVTITIDSRKMIVDGFDPLTNTVYEFLGDYWHGNFSVFHPDSINKVTGTTFRELNEHTFEKIKLLENNNYKVVYIWERDYIVSQKRGTVKSPFSD